MSLSLHSWPRASLECARDRIAGKIVAVGITADAVSIVGAVICVAAGAAVFFTGDIYLGCSLFLLGSLCDAVDGVVARIEPARRDYTCGAFLDCCCDKTGELAFLCGLVLRGANNSTIELCELAAILGLWTAYAKASSSASGVVLRWSEARVWGRAGRIIILSSCMPLLIMGGATYNLALLWCAGVLCVFNGATLLYRVKKVFASGGHPMFFRKIST